MIGEVLEPRVFLGSVPMLHFGRDSDDGAGSHLNGSLAPFLIPSATSNANQYLHLLVMYVPVVAATGLEGDILQTRYTRRSVALRRAHHAAADVCKVTLTDEILAVGIRFALGPLGAQGIAFIAEPC